MVIKVGINGFGRIGRKFFRSSLSSSTYEVIAINDLTSPDMLAHLLKYDSVAGNFEGDVSSTDSSILVDGKEVKISAERDPANLPWKELGVDIVVESTGFFTKKVDAEKHIQAGAKKVVISAPAKNEDITIVMGVNEEKYDPASHHVVSNASCTTNCLAPVVKVLLQTCGIKHGYMTTVHSYTNDQKILDLPHGDKRRARAAALSMIPTSTGAAKAVSLVIPEVKGKLDGSAIRVPTPNVSLVDLVIESEKATTAEELNEAFKAAAEGSMKGFLGITSEPLVSIDFNGNALSSTVDGLSTKVVDGTCVTVLSWYDNETGYSNRVSDLIEYMISKGL